MGADARRRSRGGTTCHLRRGGDLLASGRAGRGLCTREVVRECLTCSIGQFWVSRRLSDAASAQQRRADRSTFLSELPLGRLSLSFASSHSSSPARLPSLYCPTQLPAFTHRLSTPTPARSQSPRARARRPPHPPVSFVFQLHRVHLRVPTLWSALALYPVRSTARSLACAALTPTVRRVLPPPQPQRWTLSSRRRRRSCRRTCLHRSRRLSVDRKSVV